VTLNVIGSANLRTSWPVFEVCGDCAQAGDYPKFGWTIALV